MHSNAQIGITQPPHDLDGLLYRSHAADDAFYCLRKVGIKYILLHLETRTELENVAEPTRKTLRAARQPDRVKLPYPADRAADRAQLDDRGQAFFIGCINCWYILLYLTRLTGIYRIDCPCRRLTAPQSRARLADGKLYPSTLTRLTEPQRAPQRGLFRRLFIAHLFSPFRYPVFSRFYYPTFSTLLKSAA